MKCKQAQHRLLATSGGRHLPDEVTSHLTRCPRCRLWQNRLTQIDEAVKHLPRPSSRAAKDAFIAEFLTGPAVMPAPGPLWSRPAVRIGVMVVAAASILLLAFGIGPGFRGGRPTTPGADPLLAAVMKHNAALATADTPQKKVQTLADLADDLHGNTRSLARVASGDDLATLARLYRDVVSVGIVTRADDIPAAERKEILFAIADRLFRTREHAAQLATDVPPAARPALLEISRVAEDADRQLRRKAGEERF
jgi:hypothetical protein